MSDNSDHGGRGGGAQAPLSTASSLIRGLKVRDWQAWSIMVELYLPLVYSWCQRAGVPADDIRDVTQEVFQAVAKGVENLRHRSPDDSFRGWLKGISRHKIQDYWRRNPAEGRASGGTDAFQRLQATAISQITDHSACELSDRVALVNRAIGLIRVEFEPATWQAFWRVTIEGEHPRDVASHLNLSINSVYQAKSRVMRRLRECLGDLSD